MLGVLNYDDSQPENFHMCLISEGDGLVLERSILKGNMQNFRKTGCLLNSQLSTDFLGKTMLDEI
jgi:hypothetical protein